MVVAPDTSVWIDFLRGGDDGVARELRRLLLRREVLLLGPVRLELLAGASRSGAQRLGKLLRPLPLVYPEAATWTRAEAWALRGARAGAGFGLADLLIGALCSEHGATLWTRDADFTRMAALGLLELHAPA